MAQSILKVVILFIMASSCVILTSTVIAMKFILDQRREYYNMKQKTAQDDNNNNNKVPNRKTTEKEELLRENKRMEKTIRPSQGVDYKSELKLHQTTAPDPSFGGFMLAADAHLGIALRHLPLEQQGGGNLAGNAIPPNLLYAEFGPEPRGVQLVQRPHELKPWKTKDSSRSNINHNNNIIMKKSSSRKRSRNNKKATTRTSNTRERFYHMFQKFRRFGKQLITWTDEYTGESLTWKEWQRQLIQIIISTQSKSTLDTDDSSSSSTSTTTPVAVDVMTDEEIALFHLEKASEMGNHHAMNMIANTLASGILPVDNSDETIARLSKNKKKNHLVVTDDFSVGGKQLSQAIQLWHASAMEGNIESAMALGYRHWYSALGGRIDAKSISPNKIIQDSDVIRTIQDQYEEKKSPSVEQHITDDTIDSEGNLIHHSKQYNSYEANTRERLPSSKESSDRQQHSASSMAHYGVLGTCESAMTYYEAAANAIMDDLESSPLRGKTAPYIDHHQLAEIHIHGGASSALAHYNKPDELEEALQYYRIRAAKGGETDIHAAYTLANLYHFGIRGVKQDLRLALKYYEIAADIGSWEAAGQAGKFHLWGMGIEEEERDLEKAYRYFQKGTPGGLEGCRYRLKTKSQLQKKKMQANDMDAVEEDDDDEDELDIKSLCDHPCVNGMGLLHAFGIPGLLPINHSLAEKYFTLGRDMGNMDSSYNLAMMRLGWLKYRPMHQDDADNRNKNKRKEDIISPLDLAIQVTRENRHKAKNGDSESTSDNNQDFNYEYYHDRTYADYSFAMTEFQRASKRGHLQAKHRLAMMYAHGVEVFVGNSSAKRSTVAVSKSCIKALSLYKDIADNGITISRRLRAAYKQFVKGDYDSSLRNYLVAAETGSATAQANAAFLLERGHCLGMNHSNCMKASVRLWKAAAKQGSEEAYLRVGDFYYYGRLTTHQTGKTNSDSTGPSLQRSRHYSSFHPFWWVRYVLYPEDLIPITKQSTIRLIRWLMSKKSQGLTEQSSSSTISNSQEKPINIDEPISNNLDKATESLETSTSGSCIVDDNNDDNNANQPKSCQNNYKGDQFSTKDENDNFEAGDDSDSLDERYFHLSTAAHYYRKAAEDFDSARANFNLGFMHQWGIGLKQDFPLAKRHYDLAGTKNSVNANFAVTIALFCMKAHEEFAKFLVVWNNNDGENKKHSIFQGLQKFFFGESNDYTNDPM